MFFVTSYLYNINLFKDTIIQFDFLLKFLLINFLNSFIDSNEISEMI